MSSAKILTWPSTTSDRSLTLVFLSLFVNTSSSWRGMGTTPLWTWNWHEQSIIVPKYYRVGSPLFIDTKIMKIGQRITPQWLNETWPTWKYRFSVKYRPKLIFFAKHAKKVPNIRISPGYLLLKNKGNGVSNMFCKF